MSDDCIRAIVVDDEPLGRDRIRMFAEARSDVEVIAECADGRSAINAIHRRKPDLVFLDVQMPGVDGFDVIREIGPENMPAVIFVTAYDEHAVEAFEVHALDYLLKPFRSDRFAEAVDRVSRIIKEGRQESRRGLDTLISARSQPLDRILIKGARKAHFVLVSEIDWIESAGNYLRLHAGERVHLMRQTMKNIERQLDPNRFVRIHRCAIVNLSSVKELHRTDGGEYIVVLVGGKRLRLSRGYRNRLDRFDPLSTDFAR
jgi:two-component system, LytTR family, response regulator